MSFFNSVIDTVRGTSEGVQAIGNAWTAPQRAAELRRQQEADRRERARLATLRGDAGASYQQGVQQALGSLPLARQVQALGNEDADTDQNRQLRADAVRADIAGNLLDRKGDVQTRLIGANYAGQQSLDQLKYDRMLQLVGGQQGHELAVMDRFLGDTPLAERVSSDRDKDRQLAVQLMDAAKPTWLQQAASVIGPAALAASAFIR